MSSLIKIGQKIPPFETTDSEGGSITDEDLLGAPFILYFYPKDDTPGCTKEACQFRDIMDTFDDLNVMVVGISPDGEESHRRFIEKHDLNFPLITDESLAIGKAFGVIQSENGQPKFIRTTFLCNENGIVQWLESPVNVEGHADRVVKAMQEVLA